MFSVFIVSFTNCKFNNFYCRKSTKSTEVSEYGEEISSYDQPTIFRLILAIWYIVLSRSEFLCYFFIFLNQIKTATLLTLPLPLMVFFWGSLTIPRPSKTFWITIIAYTEVIVLLKCIFQFSLMPGNVYRHKTEFHWSSSEKNVLYPPSLFGLHREKNYAFWDLFVLLVVFFHRYEHYQDILTYYFIIALNSLEYY